MISFRLLNFVALLIVVSNGVDAKASELGSHSLRGMSRFTVLVEDLGTDLRGSGLTKESLQTQVELRLRQLGVPVVALSSETRSLPWLYVQLTTLPIEDDPLRAASVSVQVRQAVPTLNSTVITWVVGGLGVFGVRNLSGTEQFVLKHIDTFANEYLTENPRNP